MTDVADLIGFAIDKNPVDFASSFEQIVREKAVAAIENKKIELAQSLYGGEETDFEDEDDDIEDIDDDADEDDDDSDDLEIDDDDLDLDDLDLDDLDLDDLEDASDDQDA